MKVCPGCGGYSLYDDDKQVCPICGRTLVPWRKTTETSISIEGAKPIIRGDFSYDQKYTAPETVFDVVDGRCHVITGTVTEINSQTRAHNRFKKIVNAITRGEPYQFGHTTHETVIRVAEIKHNGFATHSKDVFFYGDVEGRFVIGDEIATTAQEVGDRLVVRELFNKTTDSAIRPAAQLSATTIGFLALLMLLAIILFIWLLASGVLFRLIGAAIGGLLGIALSLLTAFAPIIITFLIIRYMLR